MARLSTGQAYGDANRGTAAQLLGGIPMESTPGAMAQGSINAPGLQPQAAPVSTYQQVGAPTLGGPVKFFPFPDLPTPSQDLARLATALGNFSPVLDTLAKSYVEQQKAVDTRAQAAGQAAAQRLMQVAPGQDFVTAREALWRQAQAGDPGAAAAYQQIQAMSPLQQAYTNRYVGQATLREDIASAVDRFKAIPDIGGMPVERIPPGDSRLSAAKASLYRLPANDPVGFAELAPLISAKNGEIDRAHMAAHLDWKQRGSEAATQADLVSRLMVKDATAADIAAGQSVLFDNARRDLGVERYQKLVAGYADSLEAAVLAASLGPDGRPDPIKYLALAGKANEVFATVGAGPNGQKLIDSLGAKGGVAAQLALTQKLLARYKSFTGDIDSFNGSIGERQAVDIIAATKLDDPNLTPAQRDAAGVQADLMVRREKDPARRQAAQDAVNKAKTQARTSWTAPLLAEAERNNQFSYDKDPSTEIKRLEGLKREGFIEPAVADRLIGNYRQVQGAEMRPYVNAAKEAANDFMKQEVDAMKLRTSEGGAVVTNAEREFLIQRRAEVTSSIEQMRRKSLADGTGADGFSRQINEWVKTQQPRAPKPKNPNMQPLSASPEAWQGSLGFFGSMGPGNAASNYQLRQRVDNGLVMPETQFRQNFTDWVENGRMSDAMKLMIKRSGYGANPSQFWRKQWQNNYPGVPMPEQYEKAMPERDKMKISYQPGAAAGPVAANPNAEVAMRLSSMLRGLTTGAMNALVPPAVAGEMPMATMGSVRLGAPVVGTPRLNANARAWLAAISAGDFEGASYNTYYGGGSFDNTKGHPMRVVRPKGGIASSAAGRYQFMPDTWTGLHGGKNSPMAPARQDMGAYKLALNRGVDLNTAPPTIENVRRLAPVWAALPVSATGGAGYYKGQGGAGYARFRQIWDKEFRRYSGR